MKDPLILRLAYWGAVAFATYKLATPPKDPILQRVRMVPDERSGQACRMPLETRRVAFVVPDQWLEELSALESGNRDDAVGDHGMAIGRFQFTRAAWEDTSRFRRKHSLETYPYERATNASQARVYVASWLQLGAERYAARFSQDPTQRELFEIHRYGFAGFHRRQGHRKDPGACRVHGKKGFGQVPGQGRQ